MIARSRTIERRATATAVVVVLQSLAACFFLLDVAGDIAASGLGMHLAVEAAAALALLAGLLFGARLVREMILSARGDACAVAAARGALAELIRLRFAEWRLTAAEADVALFALKGLDAAEIARLRGVAPGTVRAQLARVYAKAGVGSQAALAASFIDDLIDAPALAAAAEPGPGPAAQKAASGSPA